MSDTLEKLAKVDALRKELESLRLHGHSVVEGGLKPGWILTLAPPVAKPREIDESKDVMTKQMSGSKSEALAELAAQVKKCAQCGLAATRTNVVFGVGDPDARVMFIGEAPGAEEDKKGEPFVGRAGQLLTDMITAMGLSRQTVYIANIVKCRPPGNRDPLPEEVEHCEPFLVRQIEIIKPEVICALGRVAAQTLLKTDTPISRLRGEFHQYHGTPLLPTFHPAYLLRNPAAKKDAWIDLQMIMKRLGLPLPERKG